MCFVIHPNHNKIAMTGNDESLSIIKRVIVTLYPDKRISIMSPYRLYTYYEGNLDYKEIFKNLGKHLEIIEGEVREGFNSYIAPDLDRYSSLFIGKSYDKVTMYCDIYGTIPPDSEYLIDPIQGVYVSNKIKITTNMAMVNATGKLIMSIHELYEYISKKFDAYRELLI